MHFKNDYNSKLVSAQKAAAQIKSNNRVVVALGGGETPAILEALAQRHEELEGVTIDQMLPLTDYSYFRPGMEESIKHNSWFLSGFSRPLINEGRGDFTPNYFHESPGLYQDLIDVDVLLATVSPMDKHGYFSFGISVDYTKPVSQEANLIILEVNKNMPRSLGDSFIHISEVDFLIENDRKLPELPPTPPDEVQMEIGKNVSKLIEDGSTLQLGIGGIPDAVTKALGGKKNLGIHSEMLSEGMVDLVEKGIVTNKKKSLHPGKIIGSFALGSRVLYDFIDDNPLVEMHPVSYTNDPHIISKNKNMVSINSAIEIDLLGQCASESIGTRQFSGTGGQTDFVRGAVKAENGKSIITLASTADSGKYSTIVPTLKRGAVVTTSKNDVDYVVTEYGIAHLRGKTARERAEALINIAHPDFREKLRVEAPYL